MNECSCTYRSDIYLIETGFGSLPGGAHFSFLEFYELLEDSEQLEVARWSDVVVS